ncbi:MAG: hypothetical protein SVX43_18480 [Cyanobacteriota bacterium]|nr:hypothetical protein [Cyanobacteriota bacterium]
MKKCIPPSPGLVVAAVSGSTASNAGAACLARAVFLSLVFSPRSPSVI